MAELKSFFVRSRIEGKTWKVYSHKPQGRPAVVSACEGELEASQTPGVMSFTIFFGDRRATVTVAGGRATKRALFEAAQELLRQMIDAGFIYADDVEPLLSKLYVA